MKAKENNWYKIQNRKNERIVQCFYSFVFFQEVLIFGCKGPIKEFV